MSNVGSKLDQIYFRPKIFCRKRSWTTGNAWNAFQVFQAVQVHFCTNAFLNPFILCFGREMAYFQAFGGPKAGTHGLKTG